MKLIYICSWHCDFGTKILNAPFVCWLLGMVRFFFVLEYGKKLSGKATRNLYRYGFRHLLLLSNLTKKK